MVDPTGSGLKLRHDPVRAGQIAGKQTGAEAELGVVGAGDDLVFVGEGQDGHDRPEYLLAHAGHIVGEVGQNGRCDPETFAVHTGAAGDYGRAFGPGGVEMAEHDIQLRLCRHGTEVGGLVQRVADDGGLDPRFQPFQKFLNDALVDKHTCPVRTDLTGGIEVSVDRARHGVVDIGVLENQDRGLAAQFHRDLLHLSGGGCGDLFAGRHRSGQRDLGDTGVGGQRRANIAHSLHYVEQARGQPGLVQDLGNLERAERCRFRRLEDHRVSGGQGGRALPASDLCRVVPRTDADTDAQRAGDGIGPVAAELHRRPGQISGQTAEIFQCVGP